MYTYFNKFVYLLQISNMLLQREVDKDICRRPIREPSPNSSGNNIQHSVLNSCNHHYGRVYSICKESSEGTWK